MPAASTWVQKQEQAPRPSQRDFSEVSVNNQAGPGPGQEQVWISSFSPGTRTRSASTLRAGSALSHTNRAVTCLPGSPPAPHSTNQPKRTWQGAVVGCGLTSTLKKRKKKVKPSLSQPSKTPISLGRNYPLCFSGTTCELRTTNLLLVFTLHTGLASSGHSEPRRSVRHALGKLPRRLHQRPREPLK